MKVFHENYSFMFKVVVLLTVTSVVAGYGQNMYKGTDDLLLSSCEWFK